MIKKITYSILAALFLVLVVIYFLYSNFRSEQLAALEQNSQIIHTTAGSVEYQFAGNSGQVVLFLHGTPGGYDQTTEIEGFRVLTPSRPGYLRTPLEAGRSPAEQARIYIALLDALDIDKVIVMGASGGGPSAISFAANNPERTLALIAMEAVSQPIELSEELKSPPFFMRSDFFLWAALSLLDTFAGAEGIVGLLVPDRAVAQLILEDPVKTDQVRGLIWSIWPVSLRAAGQENDTAQFGKLQLTSNEVIVPTLIVHGTADVNVPYNQSQRLAEQIPHATLHTIEDADHMMPFSHSEDVGAAVDAFIVTLSL